MVAYPDRGAGNDPDPCFFFVFVFFVFFRGVGSLSQPRLNIFTVGNMRVMTCLGQGGLCSLSASSLEIKLCQIYFVCINAKAKPVVLLLSVCFMEGAGMQVYDTVYNMLYKPTVNWMKHSHSSDLIGQSRSLPPHLS